MEVQVLSRPQIEKHAFWRVFFMWEEEGVQTPSKRGLEKVLPYFCAILMAKKWETCTERVAFKSSPAHQSRFSGEKREKPLNTGLV